MPGETERLLDALADSLASFGLDTIETQSITLAITAAGQVTWWPKRDGWILWINASVATFGVRIGADVGTLPPPFGSIYDDYVIYANLGSAQTSVVLRHKFKVGHAINVRVSQQSTVHMVVGYQTAVPTLTGQGQTTH